ncbi:MAG TPA: hypothetical protein VFT77_12465 [Reyranella sp.]|jgi:hypothetical protein|nr:hypothetical protein [Reyranella sp.]
MRAMAGTIGLLVMLVAASSATAQNKVPGERALEALVKATLLTWNDANVTGNYTVFHAKLSKPFRDQFPPDRLKQIFKKFADEDIDIDVVAALKPVYQPVPAIDGDGKLVVNGYFPTEPMRVIFALEFIPSDGEWKLIGINVKTDNPS